MENFCARPNFYEIFGRGGGVCEMHEMDSTSTSTDASLDIPNSTDFSHFLNLNINPDKPISLRQLKAIFDFIVNPILEEAHNRPFLSFENIHSFLGVLISLAMLAVTGFLGYSLFKKFDDLVPGLGSKVKEAKEIPVTFKDVRGLDEAKREVRMFVEFLKNPEKFKAIGGRLPKGALLVGPPGTGKTLLARAIAGEAGVPFFYASGAEFDEITVGSGARKIRKLFEQAKEKMPSIVFIDEIDSAGQKRTTSSHHPYANQTINQLLTEMDGFDRKDNIIVIGATNRVESLDKALLRPGRFDSQIHIGMPDLHDRKEILEFYLQKVTKSEDIDVDALAKGVIGFSGSDIENLVNQAALKAASEGSERVTMAHMEDAKDRIIMGSTRVKPQVMDEKTKKISAYHEAGHTLVAYLNKEAIPLYKVTIVPKGGSLGHTAFLPEKEELQTTKAQLLAQLEVMMGGRAAEELIFGDDQITTGAADDFTKATKLAIQMVKRYGMSRDVAIRDFTVDEKEFGTDRGSSACKKLDDEIDRLLNEAYARAKEVLQKHGYEHQLLAQKLFEQETLTKAEIEAVVKETQG